MYFFQAEELGLSLAISIGLITLNRKNIWPIQDIGLLRAISNNYKKKYLPPKSFVKKLNTIFFSL